MRSPRLDPLLVALAAAFASKVTDGVAGVDGLNGASGVAVAPDGEHVYVTGRVDNALAAFDRDPTTGKLTFLAVYRDGVGGVDGLAGAADVELNPAGTRVLVAGRDDDAVAVFRRDAGGTLTFLEVVRDGTAGADGLAGTFALAVLDSHVYAAAHDEDAVSVFELAACDGDVGSGDSDGDAVCDDLDVCPGASDSFDGDDDGVPDGCDLCLGDDAESDGDGDDVCDDLDACPGFDDDADSDADGTADGCDVCAGFDDADDEDGDGVPDGCDLCLGDDAAGDADGDLICADLDCDDGDPADSCALFADGFETGDTAEWSFATQ